MVPRGYVVYPAGGFTPPVHYIVNDASGKSIVIEYIAGKLYVHANPVGIIANPPTSDWHMANLRNDVNFCLINPDPVKICGVKLLPFGMGADMLGLPGDDAVLDAFHVLNNFDIPTGTAREIHQDEHRNTLADSTVWTSANDLARRRCLFPMDDNSQICSVELMRLDLTPPPRSTPKSAPQVSAPGVTLPASARDGAPRCRAVRPG